jgi:SOS-response transcriptional repressor LexA
MKRRCSFPAMATETTPEQKERAARLRKARAAHFATTTEGFEAVKRAGESISYSTYAHNENGNASFSFKRAKVYASVFGVSPEWLYDGARQKAEPEAMVRIIGRVGANPDGRVLFAEASESYEMVPAPYTSGERIVALEVEGHSMRGWVDDGALIFFEDQHSKPTPDMVGHVVIVETEDGQVLVKRLLHGSRKGRWNLESIAGAPLEDVKIRWAALPTATLYPHAARRLVRTEQAA